MRKKIVLITGLPLFIFAGCSSAEVNRSVNEAQRYTYDLHDKEVTTESTEHLQVVTNSDLKQGKMLRLLSYIHEREHSADADITEISLYDTVDNTEDFEKFSVARDEPFATAQISNSEEGLEEVGADETGTPVYNTSDNWAPAHE